MRPNADLWVVIPNWGKFQHYRQRRPSWVKVYTDLQARDDWRALTLAERGLLASLWVEYARANGLIRSSDIPARVAQKVPRRALDSLQAAGFITFSASKPEPLRAHATETETERKKERKKASPARGRIAYTGCRLTRGTHGIAYVHDVLGTDKPPPDWPHPRPTQAEVDEVVAAFNGDDPEHVPEQTPGWPITSDQLLRDMPA